MSWRHRANCRGLGGLFFVDDDHEKAGRDTYDDLRPICWACPVRVECLDTALLEEHGQGDRRYGFRGGMSGVARRREAARRAERPVLAEQAFETLREAM